MRLEPPPGLYTTITVHDPEEFREALPQSGVFDIFDCSLLLEFNPHSVIQDLEKYVAILGSCINIVHMDVQPNYEVADDSEIRITISEVPLHVAENRTPPARVFPASKPAGRPHPSNRLSNYIKDSDDLDDYDGDGDEFDID